MQHVDLNFVVENFTGFTMWEGYLQMLCLSYASNTYQKQRIKFMAFCHVEWYEWGTLLYVHIAQWEKCMSPIYTLSKVCHTYVTCMFRVSNGITVVFCSTHCPVSELVSSTRRPLMSSNVLQCQWWLTGHWWFNRSREGPWIYWHHEERHWSNILRQGIPTSYLGMRLDCPTKAALFQGLKSRPYR